MKSEGGRRRRVRTAAVVLTVNKSHKKNQQGVYLILLKVEEGEKVGALS